LTTENFFQKGVDFLTHQNYNKGVLESEVRNTSPRTGRPKLEDPNTKRLSVCLNEQTMKQLEEYCKANGITKGEAIRKGVHLLLAQKENL
jgi:hypothetical protein